MKTKKYHKSGKAKKQTNKKQEISAITDRKSQHIRLNKYIANAGLCSRREADELIKSGKISVNGSVVTEMGTRVSRDDTVKYKGEKLDKERKVYILLNKPKDYITTMNDPKNRKTVSDLVKKACPERIYPVGRLDRNTTGVLLLTNDGELTKLLSHPRYNKKKIYHVFLNKDLTRNDMDKIAKGLNLEDGLIQVDAISYPEADDKKQVGIEIHSGRNRIVKRIFEHLGYKIEKLDRVYFAGLTKRNLSRGQWRFLSKKEIAGLKMGAFK